MPDSNQDHSHDSGSFLTGLSVGLIGGAVGYFLFGTDKGSDVRKKLQKEWQAAKKSSAAETVSKVKETVTDESLREVAIGFFQEIIEQAKEEQQASEEELSKKKKRTKKKLFKNV